MKILLRNCIHHSSVFVVHEDGEAVYKSSSLPSGIKDLENEVNGYNWYNSFRSDKVNVNVELRTDYYIRLKIKHLNALAPNINNGYLKNIPYIELAVEHYVYIWSQLPSNLNTYPVHGDYSIEGNILFKDDNVFVIDWEHFSAQGGVLGFDAMYLLFETLWLNGNNSKVVLNHIIKMIRFIQNNNCLHPIFLNNPLSNIISFMQEHRRIWGEQFQKMPIVNYATSDVVKIDNYINEGLPI